MTTKTQIVSLSRDEQLTIANAINEQLKAVVAQYHASCDRGAPNLVLFTQHGRLSRLRDKILTGKDYAQQDAEASDAAEASERADPVLMGCN